MQMMMMQMLANQQAQNAALIASATVNDGMTFCATAYFC